jgi:hypothetical protein
VGDLSVHTLDLVQPSEVFDPWPRAQRVVDVYAREATPSPHVLRATGFLTPERAECVAEWFTDPHAPFTPALREAYRALAQEAARLSDVARQCLGVRVSHTDSDPYASAAELCAELREHGTMSLERDDPHPLLGGAFDQLRVVHDVFGHAALGLGFDLQSEYATWLQCRTLFSPAARPAAFCELVGAVTAYVMTGEKPGLRAKLPPAALLR